MTKYFKNVKSLEDLKNQFKALARKNHPDAGGDAEIMKAINCEYDALFPIWKDRHNAAEPQNQTAETADSTRSQFYTDFGWEGEKHDWNRSLKEVAQIVRTYVKQKYPTYKFSVRTSYASMCQELHVELKESPIEIYKAGTDLNDDDKEDFRRKAMYNNVFSLDCWTDAEFIAEYERATAKYGNFYKIKNDITKSVVADVDSFVKSYNYSDCDGMIDYFHMDFYYFGCKLDDLKVVPKTARIKNKTAKPIKANNSTPKQEKTAETANTALPDKKSGYTYKISKGEDTRDGSELWLVRVVEKLDSAAYIAENKAMQERGGYYSEFRKAFIFRFDPYEILAGGKAA